MKKESYIKVGVVLLIALSSFSTKAQSEQDIVFYYVENLSSENYSSWITSLTKKEATSVVYSCIPANIVGIKKGFKEQFSSSMKNTNLHIKSIDISEEEANEKCASKRKL